MRLPELLAEAGLLQVVTGGARTGATLVAHPGVDKVSFTGSSATGRLVLRSAADSMKRVSVELGGKSPNIVFPDADLAAAIAGVVWVNDSQIAPVQTPWGGFTQSASGVSSALAGWRTTGRPSTSISTTRKEPLPEAVDSCQPSINYCRRN